ncbi:octopamine receptor 1-like [Patiria miniata]|uniref:G-protein coupled receptors family 1 profile domain-containing protein n=1 Tax=Patiria miniata TaxID=46514 RepID=A0A913Z1C9_PATMI|nr:octopamine receptor 1-like [Patiria miniata]
MDAWNTSNGSLGGNVYASYAERLFISGATFVACFVGLLGNLAVIFAILTVKKLQTATNVFVFNLAVADVLTCILATLQGVTILYDELVFPIWVCKLVAFGLLTCIGCSINCLVCIAVNRLIGITTAAHSVYRKLLTPCKLSFALVLTWFPPLVVTTIPLVSDYAEFGYNPTFLSCTWQSSLSYTFTYAMLIAVVFLPIQFLVLFVSYLKIFLYVRKTSRSTLGHDATSTTNLALQRQLWERQVAVTKNLFLVLCVFLLCLSPYFLFLALFKYSNNALSYAATILVSNSSINPIIYATRHQDFRAAFAGMVHCRRKRRSSQTTVAPPGRVCSKTTTNTDVELQTPA